MLTRAEQARYLARGSAAAVWAVLPLPADGEAPVLLAFALRCGRTVLAVLPTILPMALPAGTPLVVTVPLVETVVGVPLPVLMMICCGAWGCCGACTTCGCGFLGFMILLPTNPANTMRLSATSVANIHFILIPYGLVDALTS